MEVRLVRLLGSISTTTTAYTLARLEFAMRHPELPSPPVIDRLSDASDGALRERWDQLEHQLEAASLFLRSIDDRRRKRAVYDQSFGWLQRTTRELDQYARAVRWVMTVEDGR
ncbi:MAG: hypothetical protein GIW95_03810 [Candidatus Eremiobacteraeota bacterium]|nr:hypothetical protein [Candidatus Eremiobacteraeota bacterium]